jgi:hypothetical protein
MGEQHRSKSTLSPPQLLQRFEQISVLVLKLCKQYVATSSLIVQSSTPTETRSLSHNTQTLSSQVQIAYDMCQLYTARYPQFGVLASFLSQHDSTTLYSSLASYSYNLWQFLKHPLPTVTRSITIYFITILDAYIVTYLLRHTTSSHALLFKGFSAPAHPAQPSLIHQVSYYEVTVDPYLKAFQENYSYPLQPFKLIKRATQQALQTPNPPPLYLKRRALR